MRILQKNLLKLRLVWYIQICMGYGKSLALDVSRSEIDFEPNSLMNV